MVIERAFKDQNTRKLVSFHILFLICSTACVEGAIGLRVDKLYMRHHAGFFWDITPDIIVSCELGVQRTPHILMLRKFGALLYILYFKATVDCIVSTCKYGVVTTILQRKMFLFYENIFILDLHLKRAHVFITNCSAQSWSSYYIDILCQYQWSLSSYTTFNFCQ